MKWLAAIGLAIVLGGCASTPWQPVRLPPANAPVEQLVQTVGNELLTTVCQAAAIDPRTGQELVAVRRSRRARQLELDKWFDTFHRSMTLEDCKTDADRRNYHDLHQAMAGRELLALPAPERRQLIRRLTAALAASQTGFARGLTRLAGTDAGVQAALAARCAKPPTVSARWFGRGAFVTLGAVYLPHQSIMLINVDQLTKSPEELVDSLEHELCHHLLPVAVPPDLATQPWVEGFTEAVAELAAGNTGGSVEYPVQTAYATLFLTSAPGLTMRHLTGLIPRSRLARELEQSPDPLAQALGAQHATFFELPPARLQAVNQLLTQWGWKEDDGSPMDITRFTRDGRLQPAALNHEFLKDRLFGMDLVRALTVLDLQQLKHDRPTLLRQAADQLPGQLRQNLLDVLAYVTAPTRNYTPR